MGTGYHPQRDDPQNRTQTGARTAGGLTQRQEAFCLAFVETGNASEAYRRAYNAQNMSADAVNVEASRLVNNPKVSLRVAAPRTTGAELVAALTVR